MLARWIVDQRIVTFEWQSDRLMPIFQFDLADMSVRPKVASVLTEPLKGARKRALGSATGVEAGRLA